MYYDLGIKVWAYLGLRTLVKSLKMVIYIVSEFPIGKYHLVGIFCETDEDWSISEWNVSYS